MNIHTSRYTLSIDYNIRHSLSTLLLFSTLHSELLFVAVSIFSALVSADVFTENCDSGPSVSAASETDERETKERLL